MDDTSIRMSSEEKIRLIAILRDIAMGLIRKRGNLAEFNGPPAFVCHIAGFEILYTPKIVSHGMEKQRLDIWNNGKKLSLALDSYGAVEIITYQKGEWSDEFLILGAFD